MRAPARAAMIVALALAGCAIREANLRIFDDQRPVTDIERTTVAKQVRETFFDPYSIRDGQLSYSAPSMTIDGKMLQNVCLVANSKNRMGAYTGRQSVHFVFEQNGHLVSTSENSPLCIHPKLRYLPFSEIESPPATR